MPLPDWLSANIHTDNGSLKIGRYESVEFGSFSICENGITTAQARVLVLGALGLRAKEAAEVLGCGDRPQSISGHRYKIFKQLMVRTMAHAVTRSFEEGIFTVSKTTSVPKPDEAFDLGYVKAIAQGSTNKDYAAELNIDVKEVDTLSIATERTFLQQNMAGVTTLCHLAEILPAA